MRYTYNEQKDPAQLAEHRLAEWRILTNRLNRQWRRVVKEAFYIAKDQGLAAQIVSGPVYLASEIVLQTDGDQVDISPLVELAKENLPSLVRRYEEGIARHEVLTEDLRDSLCALSDYATLR